MSTTPDPGEGYRLVTDYSEEPHPSAGFLHNGKFLSRPYPHMPYLEQHFYRVPIDPTPVPPIPLAEDPLPFFNEPDRSPVAVVWIVAALLFATGFLLGWSL